MFPGGPAGGFEGREFCLTADEQLNFGYGRSWSKELGRQMLGVGHESHGKPYHALAELGSTRVAWGC